MLLYTLTVLWFARDGHRHHQPPARPWYRGRGESAEPTTAAAQPTKAEPTQAKPTQAKPTHT